MNYEYDLNKLDLNKNYDKYAYDVIIGNIVVGKYIKLACERYVYWLSRSDIYLDYADVDKKIRFMKKIKHAKGEFVGQHFELYPYQEWITANIVGFKYLDTNERVINTALLLLARKSGKTFFASALMLALVMTDGEEGAEGYMIANSAQQASIAFEHASNHCRSLDPDSRIFSRYRSEIRIPLLNSKIKILSADTSKLDGLSPSVFIQDEAAAAKTSENFDILRTGQGARKNPLGICITSAGYLVGEEYPLYSMWKTSIEMLERTKTQDALFAAIYQIDENDDWKNEACWIKANPTLGGSISYKFLKEQVIQGSNNPTQEVAVKTKNFNMFCQSEQTWISNENLLAYTEKIDLKYYAKLLEDQGLELFSFCGVDLGSNSDFTAIAVLFAYNEKLYFKVFMFVPTGSIEKSKNKDLYRKWIKDGYLFTTNSNRANYEEVMITVREINGLMPVLQCAYDRYNASDFVKMCEAEGIVMTPFSQRCAAFNEPTKEFERRLMNGEIVIDDNPVLRWCFANILIERDRYENMKPTKAKGASGKIDGVIALLQAFGVYMQAEGWVAPAVTNV